MKSILRCDAVYFGRNLPNVSEEPTVSIFRVDNEDNMFFWNSVKFIPDSTASPS